MERIKQKLENGEWVQVRDRVLCLENNEYIIKRINFTDKKIETESNYNDFEIALTKLIKR